jgi:predicted nucleic acid-binding protein
LKIFVDTNVFFYAQDDRLPTKSDRCRDWIATLDRMQCGAANLQVANEFTNVVLKRMPNLADEAVFALADYIMVWGRNGIRRETMVAARQIRSRFLYSWWD